MRSLSCDFSRRQLQIESQSRCLLSFIMLNPDLRSVRLEALYGKLANVVLSLSTIHFNRIGSLDKNGNSTWDVLRRPLSYSMNEIVQLGTLLRSKLPTVTYDKGSSYVETLAALHISHLRHQKNEADIPEDVPADTFADDCRRKCVARFLFQKIVRNQDQRRQWISHENGPFPVWCDDFRPENVLVDEAERVVGVVDWEFTYTAPVEFTYAPPWWLLLVKPEDWPNGLDDWCTEYEKALRVFLVAMRKVEDDATQKRWLLDGERLSCRMRDSWQSGDFWIMYAARNNFASDAIYWKKIDRRFFGSTLDEEDNVRDAWRQRLDLLEPEETKLMEEYVDLKLKELNTPVFAWDKDEYTLEWIQKMRAVRKIKEAKEKMESLVLEWDDDLEKTMEMERKGEFEKSKVVNMINEMREEMERMEIQWKVDIKDIKGMEMKEEILDMKKRKTRKEAEWGKEIKRMEMESKAETDFPKALVRFALAFFFYLFNYRDNCKYSVSQSISPRDTICFRGLYDKE